MYTSRKSTHSYVIGPAKIVVTSYMFLADSSRLLKSDYFWGTDDWEKPRFSKFSVLDPFKAALPLADVSGLNRTGSGLVCRHSGQ